ncbi:uncharacterized protein [Amphiura filiformis]|uniref:uncharacterized protein n=1 Tax=Amphiura filiformis TaxID=82378 RepID=UPI003B20C4BF
MTEDNIILCPDLTYNKVALPNVLGHQTQIEVTKALSKLLLSISEQDFDCPIQEFACHTYLPPCRESSSIRELILPCRMVCERARQACEKSISWPVLPELSCDKFPMDYGSYYRCWEPKDGIFGNKLPCQQVPVSTCRQLGFRYTRIQASNPFQHKDIDEALEAFYDKELQNLMSTGCSTELASFVCASFFPPCIDGEVTKPCNKVCRRTWKACKHEANTLGFGKHEIFRCSKRYPQAPPTDVYSSYYDKHERCLMNIQAPQNKPKINDITRLRTSIVFYTSSSDQDVASFLVSTYKLSLPESILHPTQKSQYNAYKLTWLEFAHDWQGEIQIGDPDAVSGSTPLDPEASYFVTVQAQNTHGTGPMTVVALPKYDAQRLLFYSSVTPDRVNWLEELDQNLTFFRLQYNPNQIICVNLDTGNQNSPQWVKEDCIVSSNEGSDEVTNTISLSTEMTLLNIARKDFSTYTCSIRGLQSTVTTSFAKCERAENYICRTNGDYTILPNSFGHTKQQESEMTSYVFLRLLRHGCANDTSSLKDFVCLAYAPSVDSCEGDIKRIVPCREVCEMAYEACQDDMELIGFEWPLEAACDNFPSIAEDSTCHMPGMPEEQNDEEIESNKIKTNDTSRNCDFKARRYDVLDFGVPYLFSGWVDVQGQGAANDFCRVVRNSIRSFLSCSLAGSEGHSEYNYNSPNALIDEFEPGHMDTWYMKDEDGDGRDDYCRCVGNIPDTYVSCMKAGPEGFDGHYDFTPKGTTQPCHFIKVNPYFGPPPL